MKIAKGVILFLMVGFLTAIGSISNVEAGQVDLGIPKLSIKRINDGTGVKLTVKRVTGADYYTVLMTGGAVASDENASESEERSIGYIRDDQSLKYTYKITWLPEGEYKFRVIAVSKNQQRTYSDFKSVKILGKLSLDEENVYDFSRAKVGDVVKFGNYEQDNNRKNGKEAIEWIVLEKKNTEMLVISKYVLDSQPFKKPVKDINTWEKSTIRTWLNDTFYNSAFSKAEKYMIKTKKIITADNPEGISGGNNTKDKIFLLSTEEVEETYSSVFGDNYDRRCVPTSFAIAQGVWTDDATETKFDGNPCWWWLRSPGYRIDAGTLVTSEGDTNDAENVVDDETNGVRPALWISLD